MLCYIPANVQMWVWAMGVIYLGSQASEVQEAPIKMVNDLKYCGFTVITAQSQQLHQW